MLKEKSSQQRTVHDPHSRLLENVEQEAVWRTFLHTQEQIIRIRCIATYSKYFYQIIKLADKLGQNISIDWRVLTDPWMSPTTVTGALTCTTFDSRIRTSLVFSHISRRSTSCNSCFLRSWAMQASRSKGAILWLLWKMRACDDHYFGSVWLCLQFDRCSVITLWKGFFSSLYQVYLSD